MAKHAHWSAGISAPTKAGDWPRGFWYVRYTRGPVETTTKKSMETNNGIWAKNPLSQPRPVT